MTGVDLNVGMLTEAAKHVPAGFRIEWREADATELPCGDAAFDVVLCQQGVQFFPEKALAVAEMHRVLASDGRVVVSVWRGLEHNAFPAIQSEALARHLGAEFGTMMAAPFAYGDAGTFAALFRSAGFRDVKVEAVELTPTQSREPERVAEKFLALPMAETIAKMPDAARQAMIEDILSAIPGNPSDPAVLAPTSAHILTARR